MAKFLRIRSRSRKVGKLESGDRCSDYYSDRGDKVDRRLRVVQNLFPSSDDSCYNPR